MTYPPAGWYEDPAGDPSLERFWNGDQWTVETRPIAPPPPTPAPVPAPAHNVEQTVPFGSHSEASGLDDATQPVDVGGVPQGEYSHSPGEAIAGMFEAADNGGATSQSMGSYEYQPQTGGFQSAVAEVESLVESAGNTTESLIPQSDGSPTNDAASIVETPPSLMGKGRAAIEGTMRLGDGRLGDGRLGDGRLGDRRLGDETISYGRQQAEQVQIDAASASVAARSEAENAFSGMADTAGDVVGENPGSLVDSLAAIVRDDSANPVSPDVHSAGEQAHSALASMETPHVEVAAPEVAPADQGLDPTRLASAGSFGETTGDVLQPVQPVQAELQPRPDGGYRIGSFDPGPTTDESAVGRQLSDYAATAESVASAGGALTQAVARNARITDQDAGEQIADHGMASVGELTNQAATTSLDDNYFAQRNVTNDQVSLDEELPTTGAPPHHGQHEVRNLSGDHQYGQNPYPNDISEQQPHPQSPFGEQALHSDPGSPGAPGDFGVSHDHHVSADLGTRPEASIHTDTGDHGEIADAENRAAHGNPEAYGEPRTHTDPNVSTTPGVYADPDASIDEVARSNFGEVAEEQNLGHSPAGNGIHENGGAYGGQMVDLGQPQPQAPIGSPTPVQSADYGVDANGQYGHSLHESHYDPRAHEGHYDYGSQSSGPMQHAGALPPLVAGLRSELLSDAGFRETSSHEVVTRQNTKMLKVLVGEEFLARQGSMVAFQGEIDFDYEGSGASRFFKKVVTGEGLSLMRCSGQGEVFLADAGRQVHIIYLEGSGLTINARNVLALQSSLSWDVERVKGAGMATGGLFNTRVEGHGWVAITTDGEPVVLNVDRPTFADTDAAVAWSTSLSTTVNRSAKLKSLVRGGTGELFQLAFSGQGVVIVQPSEGGEVPPHSHS